MQKDLKLKVEGIVCIGCAEDMQTILKSKDGIFDASVSYGDGLINIRYDPNVIDARQVYMAVRKLGFQTQIVSE